MFVMIHITKIQVGTADALSLSDFLINVYTGKNPVFITVTAWFTTVVQQGRLFAKINFSL